MEPPRETPLGCSFRKTERVVGLIVAGKRMIGSLEVGKQATLLITTGTPLDMTSNIDQAYIQGRELNMMDIQKWFFQKYMEKIKQQPKPVP